MDSLGSTPMTLETSRCLDMIGHAWIWLDMIGYDWTCNLQIFRVPPKQYLQVLHLKISVYTLHPEVDIRKAQLIPGGWWWKWTIILCQGGLMENMLCYSNPICLHVIAESLPLLRSWSMNNCLLQISGFKTWQHSVKEWRRTMARNHRYKSFGKPNAKLYSTLSFV